VDAKVRKAIKLFEKMGCKVSEISIPEHRIGVAVWTPIGVEGTVACMMNGNGFGTNWKGLYVTSLLDTYAKWRHHADELSHSLAYVILLGQYMLNQYGGHFYAKAQNVMRRYAAAYDAALAQVDVLVMPTLPMKATPIPPPDASKGLVIKRAHEMFANTAIFDSTGHPALTVPCGLSDGLPVGLMLVGRQFDEATLYRAAFAFEQAKDWKTI
jgi:amidase